MGDFLTVINTRKVSGAKEMRVLLWEESVNEFGLVSCRMDRVGRANLGD